MKPSALRNGASQGNTMEELEKRGDEVRKIWSFRYFCPWSCVNFSVNVILCEILMKVMECHELLQRWFEWYVSIMVPFYFVCKMNRIFLDLFSYWISWVEMGFPLPRNSIFFPEFADIKALLPNQNPLQRWDLITTWQLHIYIYIHIRIVWYWFDSVAWRPWRR